MTGDCCLGGAPSRRLARKNFRFVAWILPAAVALLPKCPLCLAAWLTVVTGVTFSAGEAAWVRGGIAPLAGAAVVLVLWRRALGGVPKSFVNGRVARTKGSR